MKTPVDLMDQVLKRQESLQELRDVVGLVVGEDLEGVGECESFPGGGGDGWFNGTVRAHGWSGVWAWGFDDF